MGSKGEDYDIMVLTRCHQRAGRLSMVLEQYLREIPERTGVQCGVVIGMDRPTDRVRAVVDLYRDLVVDVVDIPPVLAPDSGQNWIPPLNIMADAFDASGSTAKWALDSDDDRIMGPGWVNSLRFCLNAGEKIQAYTAVSLFVWGRDKGEELVNVRGFVHASPWLYRYTKGDRRHLPLVVAVSDRVQVTLPGAGATLPFYLIDFGADTDAERKRLFKACAKAGKVDDYTARWIEEPELMRLSYLLKKYPFPGDYVMWRTA